MSRASNTHSRSRAHGYWLMGFLALFVFRVGAQLIQAVNPVSFLPPFEAWQSGAMRYELLVAAQVAIIVYCAVMVFRFFAGRVVPSYLAAKTYLALGGAYFSAMLFRLVAGLSFAQEHAWLGATIPTVFHLVLASFLLTVWLFHFAGTDRNNSLGRVVAWTAYPVVMTAGMAIHYLCVVNGVTIELATYAPVLLGALAITFMELRFPHRREWLAAKSDVLNDASYMVVVQVVLPRFLSFFVAITLLAYLQSRDLTLGGLWPHTWPVYAQTTLMMLAAEFLRYWLHRLAHEWAPLWRLHAVHHSPHKLYWVNVARFHPIEKALQYLFDALPFIVLGVSEDVLALYFVFYGINGFFQHCNIELRLGVLNYVVSGPELHRWHHSKLVGESNHNYGNNLIVWDLLFRTWFLPRNKLVGDLGLMNRRYPMSFLGQLGTPFVRGLDQA